MQITNSSSHIEFTCTTDLSIESSSFYNIGKEINTGGAIYVSTPYSLTIIYSLFEECSAIEECGAIYSSSSSSTFKQACFSRCTHYSKKSGFEGSAAFVESTSISMTLSSIFQCSHQSSTGYISIRLSEGLMSVENNNCSHCRSEMSGFGVLRPSTGSELKFMQVSHMNDEAFHLDICSKMNFNKCNVIDNTENNCWAIHIFDTDNVPTTFTEFILWGNARQVLDSFGIINLFIRCTTDKDFANCNTQDCKTQQVEVDFFDLDIPEKCLNRKESFASRSHISIIVGFALIQSFAGV